MLVSHSRKLLFVHVQKTGGSTIKALLNERIDDLEVLGASHSTLREAPPSTEDYFTCAFVRNPWDRLVSWYTMIREAAEFRWYHPYLTFSSRRRARIREHMRQTHTNRMWRYVLERCSSFEGFIRHCTDEVEVFKGVFYSFTRNQIDYLTDEDGTVAVDFIGRTEQFEKDTRELFSMLDLTLTDIPNVNTSIHSRYQDFYSPETAEIVRERYKRDIETFGYTFSPNEVTTLK